MAFTYYVKVDTVDPDQNILRSINLADGKGIQFGGKELLENSSSADQFSEEIAVSRTDLVGILLNKVGQKVFTVNFIAKDGDERTYRATYIAHEHFFGRSKIKNLDAKDYKDELKQADHRTINWLIVGGVKYFVK